ncbi:MAG: hypothetical protein IPO83_10005 [Chitinophagaceae bacterium]|nr:hypothetical protein [Chitinophagaceae bacterium]
MISDAFSFQRLRRVAYREGIAAILQREDLLRDKDSIDKYDEYGIPMVFKLSVIQALGKDGNTDDTLKH